ncbi:hypothetical protein [Bosea sp. BK604]|uniref:hypothetical protein n=1 Tax=Bosea sp. BK604 TaxID=2512180 RepID=UPI00104E93E2|nr:hypothetical protein [Bosea sp. BK604]TCR64679.1 hypothetical protein EV560_106145 [Bosea sp. BK604]
MRAIVAIVVCLGVVALIAMGVNRYADDYAREQRLIQERDDLAAESLRSFREFERMKRVIPAYRPDTKPLPGQRDA